MEAGGERQGHECRSGATHAPALFFSRVFGSLSIFLTLLFSAFRVHFCEMVKSMGFKARHPEFSIREFKFREFKYSVFKVN